MPVISIDLTIKVRAFFTDLFKFHQTWSLPLPPFAELAGSRNLLDFNERGVHLVVALKV